MERHLNVSALGMRVSLIKPELPSLHIHSKRDRRAGGGGGGEGKVFKCRREVPGCSHMLQKECVWRMSAGSGQRRQKGGEEVEHRLGIFAPLVFTAQTAQFYRLTISPPLRFSVLRAHVRKGVCVCVCICALAEHRLHLRA